MKKMTPEMIIQQFLAALGRFERHDLSLLRRNVSERTMTAALSCHLSRFFSWYHVDCEYNRNMTEPKTIELSDGSSINPLLDVIVHRRESNEHNLLVTEAKKSTSGVGPDRDREKIEAFAREPYGYKVGILLTFQIDPAEGQPCFSWQAYHNNMWHEVREQ